MLGACVVATRAAPATATAAPVATATALPTATVLPQPTEISTTASAPTTTVAPTLTATTETLATSGLPAFSHIFIIVMENKEAIHIVGNASAPYFNSLAAQYARADNYYGVRHPSLPNYLALAGGDTFGVTSDCTGCYVAGESIVDQLEAAGRTWKGYMESMPSPCFVGNALPSYAQKHNPFIYFDNVRTDPARCARIVPFTDFAADLAANSLPDYSWLQPDMCNSMHDCRVAVGDAWLQTWVPQILASSAWQDRGVLFITFDEGSSNAGCCTYATGGRVETLVISPLVQPGFSSEVAHDHYSLLRTIEEAWGLPLLGKADCDCSPAMTDFFAAPTGGGR
jgi:phosphatidylinositol-3-phosphatase